MLGFAAMDYMKWITTGNNLTSGNTTNVIWLNIDLGSRRGLITSTKESLLSYPSVDNSEHKLCSKLILSANWLSDKLKCPVQTPTSLDKVSGKFKDQTCVVYWLLEEYICFLPPDEFPFGRIAPLNT
ncbi:unnamed protein product [Arctogadus glacialis]